MDFDAPSASQPLKGNTIELLIPTSLTPTTAAGSLDNKSLLSPKGWQPWHAICHCVLTTTLQNTDTVDCFGNGMAGFALRQNCTSNARQSKSNACINDTWEAKSYDGTKGSNYVYVASCIHIDLRVTANSMWNCVARYIERGRCWKRMFCAAVEFETQSTWKGERARAHTCAGEDNLVLQENLPHLLQGSHSGPYTWCREMKVLVWRKLL